MGAEPTVTTLPNNLSLRRYTWALLVLALAGPGLLAVPSAPDRLTSRPRVAPLTVEPARVGEELRTSDRPRRVQLADGTIVLLNRDTQAKLEAADLLTLSSGEVFVEKTASRFCVRADGRDVQGSAAFAVRSMKDGPAVVVARGTAEVTGVKGAVAAGQQLTPGSERPSPAPRLSHLLDWTRQPLAAAESPLVPGSNYAGGSLIAIDPDGQEAKLSLRKFHIDVHIEDGFARTTIDQTYFNHHSARLEGTFYFPLPPDASLSRLAMYVDGNLMEGGMAEHDIARSIYETIRYAQRDPALLEWVDGSTFKMRVFPLEPRQDKRVLLSYTQRLPVLYGRTTYRFPTGHTLDAVREWSFHARLKDGANLSWMSDSHSWKAVKDTNDLLLDATAQNVRLDRDVVLHVEEGNRDEVRFTSAEHEGSKYLMVRYRPDLPVSERRERRDWVILFESSGDRDPLLGRAQIEVARGILSHAEPTDTFAVLTASTRTQPFDRAPRPATSENVEAAIGFLEKAHLVGALDLGRALEAAVPLLKAGRNPHLVHVGSGIAAMGEKRDSTLAAMLPEGVRYVGIGVGRRWGRSFMKQAAERTGGLFTQVNPDESVSWRAFEISSTLDTPRALDLKCVDAAGRVRFLPFGSTAAQGEEFAAVAQVSAGEKLPEEVVITARVDGRPFERRFQVTKVAGGVGHLPRTWASLEIERLLSEDADKHKERIVALSKAMYVMTPFTSLLVLENDDQYAQFKVDRGRKDHWAMYPAPAKIPVIAEPDPNAIAVEKGRRPAKIIAATVLSRYTGAMAVDDWGRSPEQEYAAHVGQRMLNDNGRATLSRMPRFTPLPRELRKVTLNQQHLLPVFSSGGLNVTPQYSPVFQRDADHLVVETLEAVAPRPEPRNGETRRMLGGLLHGRPIRVADAADFTEDATRRPASPGSVTAAAMEELGVVIIRGDNAAEVEKAVRAIQQHAHFDSEDYETALTDAKNLDNLSSSAPPSLLYTRPRFDANDVRFFDLVRYAHGMNTTQTDLLTVLDAEAVPSAHVRSGRIADGARRLIDRARETGWRSLTLSNGDNERFVVRFDGTGRYAWERTLFAGLREQVVCDGKTLLHLYPDLGIGARRTVSRFHREEFSSLAPWAMPSADDLARGADVTLVDEHTIVVIPHESRKAEGKPAKSLRLYLLFNEDQLAERRVVEMAEGKSNILYREVCEPSGTVRVLDGAGKELAVRNGKLAPADAPGLAPETKHLVVLPLPYRTVDHVRTTLKIQNRGIADLRFDEGLPLFAAFYGSGRGNEAAELFRQCFRARNQTHLGFQVLLASSGQNLDTDHLDVQADHPEDPLAQYLAVYSSPTLRKHASQWAVTNAARKDGPLYHLALSHALLQRWSSDRITKLTPEARKAERERALQYVRNYPGTGFAWALLCLLQDRADKDREAHAELAEAFGLFEKTPGLEYAGRYEHARSLLKAGRATDARQQFRTLYQETLKNEVLPAIDSDFRAALLGDGTGPDAWGELLNTTAPRLVEQKHWPSVLVLALQVWQLGDASRANHLLALVQDGTTEPKERVARTLAAVRWLWQTGQFTEADRVLQPLLDDKEEGKNPQLWRMAMQLAERRERQGRAKECLERALDLEFASLPEVIDVQAVRQEYGSLLEHYRALAESMETLKIDPPQDFLVRVVRLVDRWRSLDREGVEACRTAGRILQVLGDRELAWDYLTTPVALRPNESGPWQELGQSLARRGDVELADRAYRAAFEAEPTNAQLLWDRGQNLKQAGKAEAAQRVFRQLAETEWQPRFRWLKEQAKAYADGR